MPTLCIPRRKSILIETIHHSRGPTDELLFLRSWRRAARTFMLDSLQLHKLESIASARPPRRPFVDPVSAGIQFYRISRNFGRTVGFGLSPRPRSVPFTFFFSFSTAREIMRRRIRQLSRNPPAESRHGARTFRPMI